jgi:hypothetical protein
MCSKPKGRTQIESIWEQGANQGERNWMKKWESYTRRGFVKWKPYSSADSVNIQADKINKHRMDELLINYLWNVRRMTQSVYQLATCWNVRGSNTGAGTRPERPWSPSITESFPGLKWLWSGVNHPPPSFAEVNEIVQLYLPLLPLWDLMACFMTKLTFLYLLIKIQFLSPRKHSSSPTQRPTCHCFLWHSFLFIVKIL